MKMFRQKEPFEIRDDRFDDVKKMMMKCEGLEYSECIIELQGVDVRYGDKKTGNFVALHFN